jgi:hypothetical protein
MDGGAQFKYMFLGTSFPGFSINFYEAGGSTPKNVWQDQGKSTSVQQVTADTSGMAIWYADGDYRIVVKDNDGEVLWDWPYYHMSADHSTMWEDNHGISTPALSPLNNWQLFAQHSADNDFQGLKISNGTSWLPIGSVPGDIINVQEYGAVPDTGADQSAIIQRAIDESPQGILFPEGEWTFNVTVGAKVHILGSGLASVLKPADVSQPIITVNKQYNFGDNVGNKSGRTISNLTFNGVARGGTNNNGIKFETEIPSQDMYTNLLFINCHRGINNVITSEKCTYQFIRTNRCNYGIYINSRGNDFTESTTNNLFYKCYFGVSLICGLYINDNPNAVGEGNMYVDCRWEHTPTEGGFGIIIRGSNQAGHSHRFYGGWLEKLGKVASVTLDDEGVTDTFGVWFDSGNILWDGDVQQSMKVENCEMRISRLYITTNNAGITATNSSVVADLVHIDESAGGIAQVGQDSYFMAEKIRIIKGGNGRGGITMARPTRQEVIGFTNSVATSDRWSRPSLSAAGAAAITDYRGRIGQTGVKRVVLSDSADIAQVAVTTTEDKIYVYGFEIKGTSADQIVKLNISGTGTLVGSKNLYVNADRWNTFMGITEAGAGVGAMDIQFKTDSTADFYITRLFFLEFTTMEDANAFLDARHFPTNGGFDLEATDTWDPPNLAALDLTADPHTLPANTTTTITVTGAVVGDFVRVAPPYSLQGLKCQVYISAADTVTIELINLSAAAVNLGSGTWRVRVDK